MASVTQRIKQIKQPTGGYVPIKSFTVTNFDDGNQLGNENLHASIVGIVVDYLTRFYLTKNAKEAFKISLLGAKIAGEEQMAHRLLNSIKGLDEDSVVAACKLSGFDVWVRAGKRYYKPVEDIHPNLSTTKNIQIMVRRSITFFEKYGPVIKDGFDCKGGYTEIVNAGDGDFLTRDTLWDFKVSKSVPTKDHTLQLLMYYIMGKNSIYKEFDDIRKLGIFNPRMNTVYILNVNSIPQNVIQEVADNVIGYALAERIPAKSVNQLDEDEMCLSVTEVAEGLGVSKSKIYGLIRAGELRAKKVKNKYVIELSAVEEFYMRMQRRKRNRLISSVIMIFLLLAFMVFMMLYLL